MKYVSLDLETSGLSSMYCQILELGAVIEDTDSRKEIKNLPRFHCFVMHRYITFEPEALKMNWHLMNAYLFGGENPAIERIGVDDVLDRFAVFLTNNGLPYGTSITFAGKNFSSFDGRFMEKLPGWGGKVRAKHRCFDAGPLYWRKGDEAIPDLKTCADRASIPFEPRHRAVEDAEVIVALLRNHYKYHENPAENSGVSGSPEPGFWSKNG